jgi:predicted ATP-grasp superfamily ATP-dependent carboligase
MIQLDHNSTPVLILRSDSHGGLNIMRSLGPLGVDVYNLDPSLVTPANFSRYCRGRFVWDIEHAPERESLAYLSDVRRKIGRTSILIPTTDRTARFVARWSATLRDSFVFPVQPPGLVDALASKQAMYGLAIRHGVPTPKCAFPTSRAEAVDFLDSATFPIMLKGIDGQRLWERTGKKMFLVHSAEELLQNYDRAEDPERPNLMLQEYIPGGDDTIWMFNGCFDSASECLVGFTGKKIRQCPVHTGSTSLGICLPNPDIEQTTRRFMKAIGYRGILDIGYRYDARDGVYKVLDVNPRIGATFRLFVGENGIDVVRALYMDLTGQQVAPSAARAGRKWIVEDLDAVSTYRYFREGSLTIKEWFDSLSGIDEAAFLSWRDPLPFFFTLIKRSTEFLQRVYRKFRASALKLRQRFGAPLEPTAQKL